MADLLLPTAIGLWAFGVSRTDATHLGGFGLPAALPPVFYAGIAVLIVSAAVELAHARLSGWRMALHCAALTVMLYATAPLVYSQARYEWLYKTVGVVQYINSHGHLSSHIDIYQNWPGFFALTAWLDRVAGVASPLAYAKWAQLLFELAALPLLYLIYEGLALSGRQRWVALLLYSASNWVGQDYLSPQGLGTLLNLGILALAIRWLYHPSKRRNGRSRHLNREILAHPIRWLYDPSKPRNGRSRHPRGPADRHLTGPPAAPRHPMSPHTVMVISALLLLYFVLSFTHQLTPYMLALQLGSIAAVRMLRPRWLPVALGALAIGYLLPRYSFVSSHYSVLSIGHFFLNATPPAFSNGVVSPAQQFIQRSAEALSAGVWALSALAVWLRRRAGRRVTALALLAYSPIIMLGLSDYGHEGILRVYLFSLPFAAALAAMALVPSADIAKAELSRPLWLAGAAARARAFGRSAISWSRSAVELSRLPTGRLTPGTVRVPLALAVAAALFFPAFYGDDSFNRMSRQEVAVVTSFWRTAPAGVVYVPIDAAPVADTARYDLFPLSRLLGGTGLLRGKPVTSGVAQQIAAAASDYTTAGKPAYVLVTPNMIAYNDAYGLAPPESFSVLLASLARSPAWALIVHQAGVVIYELRPPPSLPAR